MSKKPILFSEWAVQRILAGDKTATMRPIKRQPPVDSDRAAMRDGAVSFYRAGVHYLDYDQRAPYQPGDILWIREAWCVHKFYDHLSPSAISDDATIAYEAGGHLRIYGSTWTTGKLRPGMFLPKRFARPNRYEVLRVEVRRPQELTVKEIMAEGIMPPQGMGPERRSWCETIWRGIWQGMYGYESWQDNDWCWRTTFRGLK